MAGRGRSGVFSAQVGYGRGRRRRQAALVAHAVHVAARARCGPTPRTQRAHTHTCAHTTHTHTHRAPQLGQAYDASRLPNTNNLIFEDYLRFMRSRNNSKIRILTVPVRTLDLIFRLDRNGTSREFNYVYTNDAYKIWIIIFKLIFMFGCYIQRILSNCYYLSSCQKDVQRKLTRDTQTATYTPRHSTCTCACAYPHIPVRKLCPHIHATYASVRNPQMKRTVWTHILIVQYKIQVFITGKCFAN